MSKHTDDEINASIETEFKDDIVISDLDVDGLYILLTDQLKDIEGVDIVEFKLYDLE